MEESKDTCEVETRGFCIEKVEPMLVLCGLLVRCDGVSYCKACLPCAISCNGIQLQHAPY